MMQESSGVASDYITTTLQFLENTFRAFTYLPVRWNFIYKIIHFHLSLPEKSKLDKIILTYIRKKS
jgi:hypothetical protein